MRIITSTTALISFLFALLFYTGRGVIFGIEGSEPTTLSIPQSTTVGNLFLALTIPEEAEKPEREG